MANSDIERQARAKELRRIWSPNLEDKHTDKCRVLPSRERLLEVLPKNGIVAEAGVAFGDFSQEIINRMRPSALYLIDIWRENDRYSAGRTQVKDRFKLQLEEKTVIIQEGLSTEVLAKFPDSFFDFIYIDTHHSYDVTFAELQVGAPKVKQGGYLAGHDFSAGNVVTPVVYGVIQACNRFCREFNWRYRYLTLETGCSFSFCLERIEQ